MQRTDSREKRLHLTGPEKGKAQTFEELWCCAVFELYNITNADKFRESGRDATDGKLSREEFVARTAETESPRRRKDSGLLHPRVPALGKEHHVSTHPGLWYLAESSSRKDEAQQWVSENDHYRRYYESSTMWLFLRSLVEKGEYDKAIKLAAEMRERTESQEKTARSLPLWVHASRLRKGELDVAIADLSEAIRLDPKDASFYKNRGYAYDQKGDLDKAIADYSEAIRLDAKTCPGLLQSRLSSTRGKATWTRPLPTSRKPSGSA